MTTEIETIPVVGLTAVIGPPSTEYEVTLSPEPEPSRRRPALRAGPSSCCYTIGGEAASSAYGQVELIIKERVYRCAGS